MGGVDVRESIIPFFSLKETVCTFVYNHNIVNSI
jgi:hypothetical protein